MIYHKLLLPNHCVATYCYDRYILLLYIAMCVNHVRYALSMYFRMLVVEHWTTKHKIAGWNPRLSPTHVLMVFRKMVAVHIW